MSIKNRGFASFSTKKLREATSKGGKTAHRNGHAHEWDSETGATAGAKGRQTREARRSGTAVKVTEVLTDTPD